MEKDGDTMKIKSVSQLTGLTDRTIRFYIEEGLLSPAYTENYMGRRSFTFTQADVESLCDIAVLRKFGFTVEEIRGMTAQPESISRALQALKARKEKTLSDEQELLSVLIQSEAKEFSDIHALVEVLSMPVESLALPAGDRDDPRSRIRRFLRSAVIFLVAWFPIFLSVNALVGRLHFFHYPIIDFIELVIALFSLLPSILLMLFPRLHLKEKKRDTVKYTIILCCIASTLVSPLLTLGIISRSETTDIRNYRRLDTDCIANRYDVYQALFPTWPHYFENIRTGDSIETVYLDAHYLYRYLPALDYTYDIYAEWPLEEDAFSKEIARASAVLEEAKAENTYFHFETKKIGDYTCLILYEGDTPFEPVTGSYTYYIFAYNETEHRVRYLLCDSLENGEDQPYYLDLNWD